MKKTLFALLSVVLMSGALVGAPGVSARAADEPYPGTVFTFCDSGGKHNVRLGSRARSFLVVKSAGSGRVKGKVRVVYTHTASNKKFFGSARYTGGRIKFIGPALNKTGRWQVRVRLVPGKNSIFKPCTDAYSLAVRKK